MLGCQDHLAEDAAALIDGLEIDFLDEIETQLAADDLARNENHRCAVAVGFVQTVDEVQAAGTAAPGNRRQPIEQQRLSLGGKRTGLFVPHVDELNLTARQGCGEVVERVTYDPVTILHACRYERVHDHLRYFFSHLDYSIGIIML